MTTFEWDSDNLDEVRKLRAVGYSYAMIASILTDKHNQIFSEEQVRSALRRSEKRDMYAAKREQFPVRSKPRTFGDVFSMSVPNATVIADLHAPYHSAEMLTHVVNMSKRHQSDTLVIAGDLFNFDSVSSWPVTSERDSLQEELAAARDILVEMSNHFTSIWILNGNHDERLSRKLEANLRLHDLVNMALGRQQTRCPLYVSDYDYMFAEVWGQRWVFGHLHSFKRRPGEAAKKIAEKYEANVAVGHDHIQGYTSTEDGKHLCVSIGSMIDVDSKGKSPLWYKERRLTDYQDVQNGFLVIARGVPWLYNQSGSSSLNGGLSWDSWYAGA